MATLDIFRDDAFQLSALTSALQNVPYQPARLGQLGWFSEEGINTKSVMIEQYENVLALVPVSQRGAPAMPSEHGSRSLRSFTVPHLKTEDAILADEVLGVRAFGSESEVETIARVVGQRLSVMRRNLEYTKESHRMAAVKGTYIDAAGNTLNLFTEFGVTQDTVGFDLANASANIRLKCLTLLESIEDSLGGLSFTGIRVLCGKTFWSSLVEHKNVKDTYLAGQQIARYVDDPRNVFEFAGITFERYRGTSAVNIADNNAYAVPEGVPELFLARNAPADYIETVGTLGMSMYAKQWEMEAGRGIKMEAQSNPLHLCTRPHAVKLLTVAA